MPVKGGRVYADLSRDAERMADGIKNHAADEDFPSKVVKMDFATDRKTLEDQREAYEDLLGKASRAYDTYATTAGKIRKDYRQAARLLYGLYGTDSKTVEDFGLARYKAGRPKQPKTK